MNKKPHSIVYQFKFEDGDSKTFTVLLDPDTISLILPESEFTPEWTLLDHYKCSCCPLNKEERPHCPIAVNIAELSEAFTSSVSSENCTVTCTTPERTYVKEGTIQDGLFSIFGIIMATSDCPIMSFFKPMARFHLPFSTVEETVFRTTSIYLLRQYFEYRNGKEPDLDLKKLNLQYDNVQIVNRSILNRINSVAQKDAIIILNTLAQMLSMELRHGLNSFEYLFRL
jgi:hypothetical protein